MFKSYRVWKWPWEENSDPKELIWQLNLSTELQLWHGLRDDARLVTCDSHLWAIQHGVQQQLKFTNPCHRKKKKKKPHWSLQPHCGYPRFTLVSETDCIRHFLCSWPRLSHWQSWEYPQGHYNCVVMEIFMPLPLDGNRWLPHRCLVVKICRIMILSLVR